MPVRTAENPNSLEDSKSCKAPNNGAISASLRNRVHAADPNGGRCLLENDSEPSIVDFVHCFPKNNALFEKLKTNIEWHWNISAGSLNLDTRYNVFPVKPHLHTLYVQCALQGSWVLLPEDHIIEQYHAVLNHVPLAWDSPRKKFPVIENGVFSYRLVPIDSEKGCGMADVAIHRRSPSQQQGSLPGDDVELHKYPFETFPLVKSHLHPRFVILEAARKIVELYTENLATPLLNRDPRMRKIAQIWSAWVSHCPSRAFIKRAERRKRAKTDMTSLDSAMNTPPPARKRHKADDSISDSKVSLTPGASEKKGKRPFLSKKKLQEHTQMIGDGSWTSTNVGKWLDECLPTDEAPEPLEEPTPV